MKKYWILSTLVLSLVAPLKDAFAQPDPEIVPVVTLDGLTLTPSRVPPDETREMLDACLWRYDVKVPQKGMDYKCTLEFRQEDKQTIVLNTRQGWPFHSAPYSLELMPLPAADSSWSSAEKIKIYEREGKGEEALGGAISGGFHNPLKELKIQSWGTNPLMRFSREGEAVLMDFTVSTDTGLKKAFLVWTVHILPHKEEGK